MNNEEVHAMQRQRRIVAAVLAVAVVTLFPGCGGDVRDLKLSEMSNPETQQKLLEALTPEERNLVTMYVATRNMAGDLDYNTTVAEAIENQRQSAEREEALQSARQRASSQIQ
ncbi:hypothetical protein ACE15N_21780 (plasmid) [Xanthomonas campestris pv. passiflorae]